MRRLGIGVAAAATLLTALSTAACAAGQNAQTADERPTLDGTNAKVADMALRGIAIEAPTTPFYKNGTDADLRIVLVNTGAHADKLTSITSPSFSGWGAFSTQSDAASVQAADVQAAEFGTAAVSTPPAPQTSVPIPGASRVSYGTPDAKGALLLVHAKSSIYPGTNVTLTFTFANAGSVQVVVPVALQTEPSAQVVPGPSATGQG